MERWFGLLSQRAIKRGSFRSVPDLVSKIQAFIDGHNASATPFVWAATAQSIIDKVARIATRVFPGRHTSLWKGTRSTEALSMVVEAQAALPMAAFWGTGRTASSDGQFFPAGGRGEALNLVNARYGTEPGVKAYSHVSDRFSPFATQTIRATVHEAPYILDGLLMNETGRRVREQYADTGGFIDHVFAACSILGYAFVPRIRDLPSKRLYVFERAGVPKHLRPLVGGKVNVDVIDRNWADIRGLERPKTAERRGLVDGALVALLFHGALRRSEVAAPALGRRRPQRRRQRPSSRRAARPTGPTSRPTSGIWRGGGAAAVRRLHAATAPPPTDPVVGLGADQVNRRFAAAGAGAGLEGRRTAHSGPVGLVVELTARGAPTRAVQLAGGWKGSILISPQRG